MRARGVKGTTGTQASFLELFAGDHAKVRRLDELVAQKLGFHSSYEVTGQTYTRKVDSQVCAALAGVSESTHKTGNDLRLAAAWGAHAARDARLRPARPHRKPLAAAAAAAGFPRDETAQPALLKG